MPCLLELPAGIHVAKPSGLRFHLDTPLALPPKSCLILAGENGVGKSTFLECVLIPAIRARHRLLYLAQDMDLERTAMAATLALLGHDAPPSIPELALAWIKAAACHDTIILDEFDKYLAPDHVAAMALGAFSWVITVSHLERTMNLAALVHGFRLTLERDHAGPDVRLALEKTW